MTYNLRLNTFLITSLQWGKNKKMATYKLDAMHSEITFKVKHLMISTVTGNFTTFDATMEAEAEDGIRDFCLSRGLGDVYKRQVTALQVRPNSARLIFADNSNPTLDWP